MNKIANKPSPHSRFIPREEIDGVAAWRFSAMDGSDDQAPPVEGEAEATVDTAALDEARQQAYAEGFQHGHDAGAKEVRDAMEAAMRRTAEETAVRMAQLLRNTSDHLKASEAKIARHILELACDLARQVVRRELKADHASLQPVIVEALRELVDDGLPATVRMNPADLALMKGALQETLGHATPELVADPSISPGGCLIESSTTTVDATIQKRWARAIGNLGLEAPWSTEDADV